MQRHSSLLCQLGVPCLATSATQGSVSLGSGWCDSSVRYHLFGVMLCCHSIRGPKTSAPQEYRFVRWCVRSSRPSLWGLYNYEPMTDSTMMQIGTHCFIVFSANMVLQYYGVKKKTSFSICLQRFWPLHSTSSMPMRLPFQKASRKIDHFTRGAHVDFWRISHVLNERLQILDDNSEKKYITIPMANMLLRERPSSWFKWKLKVSSKVDFVIKSGVKKAPAK